MSRYFAFSRFVFAKCRPNASSDLLRSILRHRLSRPSRTTMNRWTRTGERRIWTIRVSSASSAAHGGSRNTAGELKRPDGIENTGKYPPFEQLVALFEKLERAKLHYKPNSHARRNAEVASLINVRPF